MKFEGEEVDESRITMRQFKGEWPIDEPLMADQEVALLVKVKVSSVSHEINQRTGNLSRTHVLHVQEVESLQ